MNLAHLKTFVAVAELRHFADARQRLQRLAAGRLPSAFAQLEHAVGAKLLNRAPRRVSLTVAGEVLLEEARRILAAVDRARERMHEVSSGAVGRIRLGASATPGLYLLPALLAQYRASQSEVRSPVPDRGAVDADRPTGDSQRSGYGRHRGRPPTEELRVQTLVEDELVAIEATQNPAHPARISRALDGAVL